MKLLEPTSPSPARWSPRQRNDLRPDSRLADHGWPVAILGVPFDNVTLGAAVARISTMIADRRPHYVATANMDFLVQARGDVELRRILLEADLVLCDGTPLVWASRWLGNPLRERVAGADLVPALIREAAGKGHRIFLLGAGAGVAASAAEHLQGRFPELIICGHYSPPYSDLLEMDHEEAAGRIREARPDLLLVSFGCPKQEKWIAMHYRSLGVPVVIGVGASLDFLAERVRRAPLWMQRSGLEWAYRLVQEPRRLFRRYANDLVRFAPAMTSQWLNLSPRLLPFTRRSDHRASFSASSWIQLWAAEALTILSLKKDARFWSEAMQQKRHCLLDLSRVRAIDSTGTALLARWRQQLHAQGLQFVLISPSTEVKRALRHLQLQDHFLTAANWAEAQGLIKATQLPSRPVTLSGSPRPLAWRGEVTAENIDQVWQLTIDLLRSLGTRQVTLVIDLSQVRFIDSSGVGLMLRVTNWARQNDTEVRFSDPQPDVLNVLQMTRLDHLLLQPA
ncbi:MAG: WecB/TagA/CpsF family glycosyl transferase [Rariglobus sp.]|jgi:N-acetylglucosaminyldiphosphoundecaprenol N-acetyl-beta-D-mannosaminyltransferase|nr:WecB/TagA/CpsF family glycosyl transferase [Rariglobus sp.]